MRPQPVTYQAEPISGVSHLEVLLKLSRAVNLVLVAAAIWMHAPALAQTSNSPRSGSSRAPARKPPPKPPPKPAAKKPPPRSSKPATPGGVVKREAPAVTFRGDVFNENANALNDITEALLRAKTENQRVLVHWGVNGNVACRTLHLAMLNDPALRRVLLYEYQLVLIDVSSRTRNLDLALSYGVAPQANGVPWLTVLSADNKPICNLPAGRFADGRGGIDAPKLAEYLRGYQVMYPAADDLVHAALAQAKTANKPLLIQFSSPACGRCGEVDRWFARADVDSILSRNFLRVRIDVDRTVGGRDVLRRYSHFWQTAIPWFALVRPAADAVGRPARPGAGIPAGAGTGVVAEVDAEGTVLATSDSLDGKSIATLADDEAIARFGEILRSNAKILTPEELAWLLKTLREMNAVFAPPAPKAPAADTAAKTAPPAAQPARASASD